MMRESFAQNDGCCKALILKLPLCLQKAAKFLEILKIRNTYYYKNNNAKKRCFDYIIFSTTLRRSGNSENHVIIVHRQSGMNKVQLKSKFKLKIILQSNSIMHHQSKNKYVCASSSNRMLAITFIYVFVVEGFSEEAIFLCIHLVFHSHLIKHILLNKFSNRQTCFKRNLCVKINVPFNVGNISQSCV